MSGLFSIFNVGVRGMTTQQHAINITSHNIANANTEGYSRQRAIMETTKPFGGGSLNNAISPGQLGTGSQVTTVQRVRDAFLDYQVRNETSTLGEYDSRDKFLSEIESIANEPTDTGISSLLGKFYDAWQKLSKQPNDSNARTVVAQQSIALANELNHAYTKLNDVQTNINSEIKQNVFDVNQLLTQLDSLNQQIISVKVGNEEPNDLMDKRDNLLDQLSSKFGINIDKKSYYGQDVTADAAGAPADAVLVRSTDNTNVRRFSYINSIEEDATNPGQYKIIYYKNADMSSDANKVEITITGATSDQIKAISENRVLWADKDGYAIDADGNKLDGSSSSYSVDDLKLFTPHSGEFKGYTSVHQDTDNYIDQMNKLAKALAFAVNAIHSGVTNVNGTVDNPPTTVNNDYLPFFVNSSTADKRYDSNYNLTGTNLADVLASEKDITAGNISVNQSLVHDVMKIKVKTNDDKFAYTKDNNLDGTTDGKRALLISDLRNSLINVQSMGTTVNSRSDLFDPTKGGNTLSGLNFGNNTQGMTIDSYFKDIIDRIGVQGQQAKRIVTNQENMLDTFTQSREEVSGVSLDEEMANLVQFNHAYQANAKIISTVDQLLDVVINGLKKN